VAGDRSAVATAAVRAAGIALASAGERRALDDLARLVERRPPGSRAAIAAPDATGVVLVAAVEGRIVRGTRLFPDGIPEPWRGVDIEAHGIAVGPVSRLSLAVRWHGPNAAVLWEVTGEPVTLTTGVTDEPWVTSVPTGEALWRLAPTPGQPARPASAGRERG
jgi:hypothetical protein